MEINILGCSGGMGNHCRTTSFLINKTILIDAGTGLTALTPRQMADIKHVFLTHSHLDHIAGLPLLCDNVFREQGAITVHALGHTIQSLKSHIFNGVIWPDFTSIPSAQSPVLKLQEHHFGEQIKTEKLSFELIPVRHTVPSAAYLVTNGSLAFAFSGDTTTNHKFWDRLNQLPSLECLIVETAFANNERELAIKAGHYCPAMLQADMKKLKHSPLVYISHLKPGQEDKIFSECNELAAHNNFQFKRLREGQKIHLPLT